MMSDRVLRGRHHDPLSEAKGGPDRALMSPAEVQGNVRMRNIKD